MLVEQAGSIGRGCMAHEVGRVSVGYHGYSFCVSLYGGIPPKHSPPLMSPPPSISSAGVCCRPPSLCAVRW